MRAAPEQVSSHTTHLGLMPNTRAQPAPRMEVASRCLAIGAKSAYATFALVPRHAIRPLAMGPNMVDLHVLKETSLDLKMFHIATI